jgi:hypothetical protein
MKDRRGTHRVLVRRAQGKNHLENLGVDGRIILTWILNKLFGEAYRIDLAQDRNRWRALVNTIMNLRFPQNAGNFLTS